MELNLPIKKAKKSIYKVSYGSAVTMLTDGKEILNTDKHKEFSNLYDYKNFVDKIIVTTSGYTRGFIYKNTNGGEIYNPPSWQPETQTVRFTFHGLKPGAYYRVTIVGRSAEKYNRLVHCTANRSLLVQYEEAETVVIQEDLTKVLDKNQVFIGVFRAQNVEVTLKLTMGKIYMTNFLVDEVDLYEDLPEAETAETLPEVVYHDAKMHMHAYGVFGLIPSSIGASRYKPIPSLGGTGLALSYDTQTQAYILERDVATDTLDTALTSPRLLITFIESRLLGGRVYTTQLSQDLSPTSLRAGYICFKIYGPTGEPITPETVDSSAMLTITVTKLN